MNIGVMILFQEENMEIQVLVHPIEHDSVLDLLILSQDPFSVPLSRSDIDGIW